jgi:hypothetical protein
MTQQVEVTLQLVEGAAASRSTPVSIVVRDPHQRGAARRANHLSLKIELTGW